jgi:hypothetical protein
MWVPKQVIEWFSSMRDVAETNAVVSIEALNQYRAQLAAITAERDTLKIQLAVQNNHFDWLRMRVNTLEVERSGLVEKAYGIKLPIPEIVRTVTDRPSLDEKNFSFEDVGKDMARTLGLPDYDK